MPRLPPSGRAEPVANDLNVSGCDTASPHTGSPMIFFGTMLLFAAIGAVVPIVWGKETVGQIEVIASERAVELA
jgi:hypothetical protein